MTKEQVEEIKNLFDSITCLCVEGPEFHSRVVLMDTIIKEAVKGYNLCKKYLKLEGEKNERK
jgi:hypothetical protein